MPEKTLAMIFDLGEFAITGLRRHAENGAVINPRVSRDNSIRFARFENDSWQ